MRCRVRWLVVRSNIYGQHEMLYLARTINWTPDGIPVTKSLVAALTPERLRSQRASQSYRVSLVEITCKIQLVSCGPRWFSTSSLAMYFDSRLGRHDRAHRQQLLPDSIQKVCPVEVGRPFLTRSVKAFRSCAISLFGGTCILNSRALSRKGFAYVGYLKFRSQL